MVIMVRMKMEWYHVVKMVMAYVTVVRSDLDEVHEVIRGVGSKGEVMRNEMSGW
jgi:hypothetical protein